MLLMKFNFEKPSSLLKLSRAYLEKIVDELSGEWNGACLKNLKPYRIPHETMDVPRKHILDTDYALYTAAFVM